MILHIQYKNDKYDYVDSRMLDNLIKENEIKQFYRPGEKKWVDIDAGPVRVSSGSAYAGMERRRPQYAV